MVSSVFPMFARQCIFCIYLHLYVPVVRTFRLCIYVKMSKLNNKSPNLAFKRIDMYILS